MKKVATSWAYTIKLFLISRQICRISQKGPKNYNFIVNFFRRRVIFLTVFWPKFFRRQFIGRNGFFADSLFTDTFFDNNYYLPTIFCRHGQFADNFLADTDNLPTIFLPTVYSTTRSNLIDLT